MPDFRNVVLDAEIVDRGAIGNIARVGVGRMHRALLREFAHIHCDDFATPAKSGREGFKQRVAHLATGSGHKNGAGLGRGGRTRLRLCHRGVAHSACVRSASRMQIRDANQGCKSGMQFRNAEYRLRAWLHTASPFLHEPNRRRMSFDSSTSSHTSKVASTETLGATPLRTQVEAGARRSTFCCLEMS